MAPPQAVDSAANSQPEIVRPLSNFLPSLWGDRFVSFSLDEQLYENYTKEAEVLKEEARKMLVATETTVAEKMELINTLERLGVSYHFEQEIEKQLEQIFVAYTHLEDYQDYDLFTTALHFRIFRAHGHNISCDVFNKFRDANGKFNEALSGDFKGLYSLYEATHLGIRGEDILDEARAFASTHLESMIPQLSPKLAEQVEYSLKQSLHRSIPRLETRRYISIYEEDDSKNENLLKFAKIDFNLVQLMHRQELCQVTRWWRDLDFASKLSYTRDRVVECFFWAMVTYFEPRYSRARIMLTKTIALSSIVDDTYDSYGLLEELKPYTDAIQRWEPSAADDIPDYMKISYKALLNQYEQFEEEMKEEGTGYGVHHSKETFKELARSYFVEAKWFNEAYVPSFDEYMRNALTGAGYGLLTTSSFMGIGKVTTPEVFEWLANKPPILIAASTVVRLMDDIADHDEEKERGQDGTGIDCYMQTYGVTKEETIAEFRKRIENAWKDINETFLNVRFIPKELLQRILNLTRVMDVLYKYDDGYTHPEKLWKDYVILLFIDPVAV